MVKTITVADDVYGELVKIKEKQELFRGYKEAFKSEKGKFGRYRKDIWCAKLGRN